MRNKKRESTRKIIYYQNSIKCAKCSLDSCLSKVVTIIFGLDLCIFWDILFCFGCIYSIFYLQKIECFRLSQFHELKSNENCGLMLFGDLPIERLVTNDVTAEYTGPDRLADSRPNAITVFRL